MTATLGETSASQAASQAAEPADRRAGLTSPRRARRSLAARVARSPGGHRVAAAMIGTVAFVAAAGVLVQIMAG
jgi:hypothetical protein